MPWHVGVMLPSGEHATADYRDPIVTPMRAILHATAVKFTDPDPRDIAAVTAWLEAHLQESADCAAGRCGHDLPGVCGERERAAELHD